MPAVTGAFSNSLAPGIRMVFFMHLKQAAQLWRRIFNVDGTKRHYEENMEIANFGVMPQKPEGSGVAYFDLTEGGLKRFNLLTFGMGFRVTEEMFEGDLYGTMNKNAKALRASGMTAEEQAAFDVLNLSFTTQFGYPKAGVNQPLIGKSVSAGGLGHTRIGDGGNSTNRPDTDVDISFAALEAAITNFMTLTDENNLPLGGTIMPKFLVHHPNDWALVEELLTSEKRPFTANNERNVLKGQFEALASQYLTDPDAWFVLADKDPDGLQSFTRREMRLENGDDFDTGDAKFKATFRRSFGASEWRRFYGSAGAP